MVGFDQETRTPGGVSRRLHAGAQPLERGRVAPQPQDQAACVVVRTGVSDGTAPLREAE